MLACWSLRTEQIGQIRRLLIEMAMLAVDLRFEPPLAATRTAERSFLSSGHCAMRLVRNYLEEFRV